MSQSQVSAFSQLVSIGFTPSQLAIVKIAASRSVLLPAEWLRNVALTNSEFQSVIEEHKRSLKEKRGGLFGYDENGEIILKDTDFPT